MFDFIKFVCKTCVYFVAAIVALLAVSYVIAGVYTGDWSGVNATIMRAIHAI